MLICPTLVGHYLSVRRSSLSNSTPFLAKFAKRLADPEVEPQSPRPIPGTSITRVYRETTDDR